MKHLLTLALLLALAVPALADYQPAVVHVVVTLPPDIPALTVAEFSISHLPYNQCLIEESWDSDLTIGQVDYGLAIAFTEPQPGPIVHLGTLTFTAFEEVHEDYFIEVEVSQSSGDLVIVDDNYDTVEARGWFHDFNCHNYCDCTTTPWVIEPQELPTDIPVIHLWADPTEPSCSQDLLVFTTPTEESHWGAVKSLY
ncbi:hypothetical protein KDL67_03420 [bacterium]|nr:hypothetical protein [bacterium]